MAVRLRHRSPLVGAFARQGLLRCHALQSALQHIGRDFTSMDTAQALHAHQLAASDHRGHVHVVALDAASKSLCAAERVQWLMNHDNNARRVLAFTADAREHSRLQRHLDEHTAFHALERRGHGVFGVLQWCQQALEETGLDKRVLSRSRTIAFLLHHIDALMLEPSRLTSPLATRRAVLDVLQHMELLEREGITPATYLAHATGTANATELALAQAYERYTALLATHSMTTWNGLVLDVLQHVDNTVDNTSSSAFLDALLRGFTDVVIDDLQAMSPAMIKLLARVCRHPTITSSLSFSRVLEATDACPRSQLFACELQRTHGAALTHVTLLNDAPDASPTAAAICTRALCVLHPTTTDASTLQRTAAIECKTFATVADEECGLATRIRSHQTNDAAIQIAVFAPTTADAQRLTAAFVAHGIGVQNDPLDATTTATATTTSSNHLFDEPGVNAIYSLLVALSDPTDARHLYNVLRSPFVDMSPLLLSQLMASAERESSDNALWDALEAAVASESPAELAGVASFVALFTQLRNECHTKSAQALVKLFLQATGRLDALLSPTTPADERDALALAAFLSELDAAQRVVQSPFVPFVVPYLLQLRTAQLRVNYDAIDASAAPTADQSSSVVVLPLTPRNVARLDACDVVMMASMRDSKFPGRMTRLTTPLPLALLSHPLPVQTRSEYIERCEQLACEALLCATQHVVLSYASVVGAAATGVSKRTKLETLSRVLLPIWHDNDDKDSDGPVDLSSVGSSSISSLPLSSPVPTAASMRMPYEPPHLSYSQISEYLRCPQRYFLARIMKLSSDASSAMHYGRALHEAIACFAQCVQHKDKDNEPTWLEAARFDAHAALDVAWTSDAALSFASRTQARQLLRQAHAALDAFCDAHATRDVEVVEHAFSIAIPESDVLLRGVFDRVDRTDDNSAAVIYEFKTNMSGAKRDVRSMARTSLQLKLYLLAYERSTGVRPQGAVLEIIGGNQAVSATSMSTRNSADANANAVGFVAYSQAATTEALDAIATVANGLRVGDFTPRPSYIECAFCPFAASACRVGADAAAAAAAS